MDEVLYNALCFSRRYLQPNFRDCLPLDTHPCNTDHIETLNTFARFFYLCPDLGNKSASVSTSGGLNPASYQEASAVSQGSQSRQALVSPQLLTLALTLLASIALTHWVMNIPTLTSLLCLLHKSPSRLHNRIISFLLFYRATHGKPSQSATNLRGHFDNAGYDEDFAYLFKDDMSRASRSGTFLLPFHAHSIHQSCKSTHNFCHGKLIWFRNSIWQLLQ